MDLPRILAITDVCLTAPRDVREALIGFYVDLIGLTQAEAGREACRVCFCGHRRQNPRLVVELAETTDPPSPHHEVTIEVCSLADCAEQMIEHETPFSWVRGWSFYERRLMVLDPGGNGVTLRNSHLF